MYTGDASRARRLLQPLFSTAGPVLADDLHTTAYADAAMGGTPARHLDFFPALPDPVIDALVTDHENPTHRCPQWRSGVAAVR